MEIGGIEVFTTKRKIFNVDQLYVILFSVCCVINGLNMTPTSNVLFPQKIGPITLSKMMSLLFFIKSINAVVIKQGFISESTSYNLGWNSSTNNTDK